MQDSITSFSSNVPHSTRANTPAGFPRMLITTHILGDEVRKLIRKWVSIRKFFKNHIPEN